MFNKNFTIILCGGPKRDEQIENMIYTIKNIAQGRNSNIWLQLDAISSMEDQAEYIRGNAEVQLLIMIQHKIFII